MTTSRYGTKSGPRALPMRTQALRMKALVGSSDSSPAPLDAAAMACITGSTSTLNRSRGTDAPSRLMHSRSRP